MSTTTIPTTTTGFERVTYTADERDALAAIANKVVRTYRVDDGTTNGAIVHLSWPAGDAPADRDSVELHAEAVALHKRLVAKRGLNPDAMIVGTVECIREQLKRVRPNDKRRGGKSRQR